VLVLANARAGTAEQDRIDEVCRALATQSPSGVEVRSPGSPREYSAAVASTAFSDGGAADARDVVVLGGDGSLRGLLQELYDQQLLGRCGAVGVVPMGTGNDLARDSGIPLRWEDAVPTALNGRPAPRGLLVDQDGQVVVNVAHCGVAAEATAHASEVKGWLGRAAYIVGSLRAGLTGQAWHLRVEVDGETVADGADRILMVSVALGSSVGGGTPIAPDAQPDDARVDVIVARATSAVARIGFARDLRKGQHVHRADVTATQGRDVLVEAVTPRDAFRVNSDGDVSEVRVSLRRWHHLPGVWSLRVPAESS
jgi:diacylglycerol kinase family enzyme